MFYHAHLHYYLLIRFISCRLGKQRLREAKTQVVDYMILLVAGAILGILAKVNDETIGSLGYTYTVIAVCKFDSTNSVVVPCCY